MPHYGNRRIHVVALEDGVPNQSDVAIFLDLGQPLAPGTYALSEPRGPEQEPGWVGAELDWRGEDSRSFIAVSGTLVITAVSGGRAVGHLDVTASREAFNEADAAFTLDFDVPNLGEVILDR